MYCVYWKIAVKLVSSFDKKKILRYKFIVFVIKEPVENGTSKKKIRHCDFLEMFLIETV